MLGSRPSLASRPWKTWCIEWSRHRTGTGTRTCPEGLEQEFAVFLVASYVNDRDLADPEDGFVIVQAE